MNIHYRIVKVDPAAHGILIRYFTDKVTEMDLANSYNEDGSIRVDADGVPLSTRTDVFMSIYATPTPTPEELEKKILISAPVDWLKLQESIADPAIDTKMSVIRNLTGESKSFTIDDISNARKDIIAGEVANAPPPSEEDNLKKAYDTVLNVMDSLKVLADKDPAMVEEFYKSLDNLRTPQK
jgi:hypothetical protein